MSEQQSPEERAVRAASDLAAEGAAVTSRGIRERAGVSMAVAVVAARDWNAREAQTRALPAVPDSVALRLEGVWYDAIRAAQDLHQAEREGLETRAATAEGDRDAALEDIAGIQGRLDQANARIAELERAVQQALDEAQARVAEAQARVAEAEAATKMAEGVAAGLSRAVEAMSSHRQLHSVDTEPEVGRSPGAEDAQATQSSIPPETTDRPNSHDEETKQ